MSKATDSGGGRKAGKRTSQKTTDKVERKLVGVRIEPRLVKVMKAVSELHDCTLGELLEQVFWANMHGTNFFADKGRMSAETRERLNSLKSVYGVDYNADYLKGPGRRGEQE